MTSNSESPQYGNENYREDGADPEFQLVTVWRTLRKRTTIIVGLGLLGLALGYLASLLTPRLYSATATIEVNKQSDSSIGVGSLTGSREQFSTSEEMQANLLTQQSELQSASVGLEVMEQQGLTTTPPYVAAGGSSRAEPHSATQVRRERMLRLFESRLKVELVKDTKLIDVTFADSDPARAAQVANAVIATYTKLYSRARSTASVKTSSSLAAQLAELRDQVLESEKRVNDYKERTGIGGASGVGAAEGVSSSNADSVIVERFIELNKNLTAAEVARVAKQAMYQATDTQSPDVARGVLVSELAKTADAAPALNPDRADLDLLTSLHQQRSQLELQAAARSNLFASKSPQMMQIDAEVAEIDGQLKAELVRIHRRAESELHLAEATEAGLRRLVAAQQQEVTRLNVGSDQLIVLEQEANSKRQLYQNLFAKLEEANISNGVDASAITVVDPARPAIVPSSPKTGRNLISGFTTGLLLGVFLAFLLDYLDDRLATPADVESATTVPVLGSIPSASISEKRSSRKSFDVEPANDTAALPVLLSSPASEAAEAYRTLRSRFLINPTTRPKRILFTATDSEDGTAAVCLNVAVAFALQGAQVLLIDADLRDPQLQGKSGPNDSCDLARYLKGSITLHEAIVPHPSVSGLHLLLCAAANPHASELLGSSRLNELLTFASSEYDYVLLTSPPLLEASDALVIVPHVDLTILVIRKGKTTKQLLRRALARLPGIKIGVVLNEGEQTKQIISFALHEEAAYART